MDGASRTAMGSAVLRALHVREDPAPWLLEDTLSESLLSPPEVQRVLDEIDTWQASVRAAFRVAHAVRTRLAEDVAVAGLAEGRTDYVLLGAGLDSFAWRHERAGSFRIWEIDHPATQEWKRRALRAKGLPEPENVKFVPLDLSRESLPAGVVPSRATWSWLGVTMYLERTAIEHILQAIAALDPGTTLVVNFVVSRPEDQLAQAVQATAGRVVAEAGEPIRSTFHREECAGLLDEAGFSAVEIYDAKRLVMRFSSAGSVLNLPDSTLLAVAAV